MKRLNQWCTPLLLLGAGALLLLIGSYIVLAPAEFYAANDITLGGNISLRNELKAPAGFLLAAGTLMLVAVFVRSLRDLALLLAAMTYLSYALARYGSMAMDGTPAQGLVQAAALELVIGVLCALAWGWQRYSAAK